MTAPSRRGAALALLLGLVVGTAAAAPPQPPCDSAPHPAWPDGTDRLVVAFWDAGDLPAHWQPPACTGWQPADFSILMAAAGRLVVPRGRDELLARIGAVSTLAGLRYWSVSRDAWTVLIEEAHAVTGPDRKTRRPDFTPGELLAGRPLHYWQREPTTSGSAVYRLQVLGQSNHRLVVSIDNAAPSRWLGIPMLDTGKAQTLYLLQRLDGDQWGYYQLTRIGHGAHDWLPVTRASYANRAGAIFRWFAGLPEDALPVWRD